MSGFAVNDDLVANKNVEYSIEQLKQGIVDGLGECDWTVEQILEQAILPYLDKETLLKIAENHIEDWYFDDPIDETTTVDNVTY